MRQGLASSLWGKSTSITMHMEGKRIGKETASIWKELFKVLVSIFFFPWQQKGEDARDSLERTPWRSGSL
jgi:hypothetical protein